MASPVSLFRRIMTFVRAGQMIAGQTGPSRAAGGGQFPLALFLLMAATTCGAADRVLLPVEIVGNDGTTASRTVVIQDQHAETIQSLWLQVHGLRFSGQASVQVNDGPWIPLSNQTATVAEPALSFGGIGTFGTVAMTVTLPRGSVVNGPNTIRFRFNHTDGIASGYRVLGLNFLTADGREIFLPRDFIDDTPDSWAPPLGDAASIQAGKKLWNRGSLLASGLPGSPRIQAHCGDCHTRDGRDLKYFNFSNESIIARSRFHGLSALEGEQIASYIRSLAVPNPGRPWNPPYQPGPGLDEQPVSHWAAGAGLKWVLERDTDTFPYLLRQSRPGRPDAPANMPGDDLGIQRLEGPVPPDLFRPDGNLNAHEIPIAFELPDWSQWLPVIHPKDAWGTTFTQSEFAAFYGGDEHGEDARPINRRSLRAILDGARNPGDLRPALASFEQWSKARRAFFRRISRSADSPELARKLYSAQQWQLVKAWEMTQEFELEGRGQEVFGVGGDARTWFNTVPEETAPAESHIPDGPNGIGGSALTNEYLNSAWYGLQIVLNSGNHQHHDRNPVDWVYVIGHFKELCSFTKSPEPARLLVAVIKSMQSTDPRLGPEDLSKGWRLDQNIDPRIMVSPGWESLFGPLPAEFRRQLTSSLLTAWLDKTQQYTIAEYLPLGLTHGYTPARAYGEISGGQVWRAAQQFHAVGISDELLERVQQFGTAYTDRAARIHYQ